MALESGKEYPPEYIEMKFCKEFGLTPFEYRRLPTELVRSWTQMTNLANGRLKQVENSKNTLD